MGLVSFCLIGRCPLSHGHVLSLQSLSPSKSAPKPCADVVPLLPAAVKALWTLDLRRTVEVPSDLEPLPLYAMAHYMEFPALMVRRWRVHLITGRCLLSRSIVA